ncbi:hypothetical protein BDV12DRAFT_195454 [Aspergillus spectabilis]
MVNQASSLDLDPAHTSCIGGRTVLTCRSCAGNAPRPVLPSYSPTHTNTSQNNSMHQLQRPRLQHLRLRTLQPSSSSQPSHVRSHIRVLDPGVSEQELVDFRLVIQ